MSAAHDWHGASRLPHPALRSYVDTYVGYDIELDPRAIHYGVPSATATVIIAFDTPLDTQWLDDDSSRRQRWTMVTGLGTRTALVHTHGHQHGIQLALTPLGVRALLGVPVAELAGAFVELADLGLPSHLVDRLAPLTWAERFWAIDGALLSRLGQRHGEVPSTLAQAWHGLDRTKGQVAINHLAAEIGWSRRHLQARFASEFGLGPKQAARLHRFDHARSLARSGVPLGQVAAHAGYSDQAHLSREWRTLAAQTPAQALAEDFPILQDGAAGVDAHSTP